MHRLQVHRLAWCGIYKHVHEQVQVILAELRRACQSTIQSKPAFEASSTEERRQRVHQKQLGRSSLGRVVFLKVTIRVIEEAADATALIKA